MIDGNNYHVVGAKSDRLKEDVGKLFDRFQELNRHAKSQYEEREATLDSSIRQLVNKLIP